MDVQKDTEQASNAMAAPDTQAVVASVFGKDKSLKGVLDTSVDSGIHDVVIKEEPVEDYEHHATNDNNMEESTVETVTVKKEPGEESNTDVNMEADLTAHGVTETCLENNLEGSIRAQVNSSTETEKQAGSSKSGSVENEGNTKAAADEVNEPKANETDKSTDENRDVIVVGEKIPSDSDVIVVDGPSNMMEYRTAGKVITVDDSSDSSLDSSDSEDDADEKKAEAKNTEAQINKIISNEREASPEREKRVKMNRHGFEDIRTKGELLPEDLPPLEELTITVDDSVVMVEVGAIKSIVGILVVIQSNENVPPLDDETILFVEGHKVLGQVFETFGPVRTPWYSIRFNEATNIEAKGLEEGMKVFCAPREKSFTKFVFVDSLKRVKGSDASWEDNNEPPEKHLDYSDDESERRAKAKRRNKKFGDNETEGGEDGDDSVQKKNPRHRNRNRANRDNQSGSGPQQQTHHPKRGWNPFQENQDVNTNGMPPRFGNRPQNNGNNSHPSGQRWPPNQDNFNRPQSRFGGPPNFQNRPRMNQNQGQQQFRGRNIPHQNGWRPQSDTNYPNNQQNCGQPSVNSPSPACRPFNLQSPPPSMGNPQNGPPGQMNVDYSQPPPQFQAGNQPPPQFQAGNQIRPPNQSAGMNPWMQPPVNVSQQNVPFIATKIPNVNIGSQSALAGNQTTNQQQMNAGNQRFNQGQPVGGIAYQNNQSNITHPGNNTAHTSNGNFQSFGMNTGQNPFNQPPPGNIPNSAAQRQPDQNFGNNTRQNYGQLQTNCSNTNTQSNFPSGNQTGNEGLSSQNFIPAFNSIQSGTVNQMPFNGQQSNGQRPELRNFQMQTIPGQNNFNNVQNRECGGNQNFVQNQNFRNNQQQGFPQGNTQTNSTGSQFA